jgi:hypothetical protein
MAASGPGKWRHAYRWDLDKTYLDTRFESLSELVRIPFQHAEDKVNVPGSAALLRELCRDTQEQGSAFVSIVSGSPRQLREVLEEKLRLDGIVWQEFHLKPQLENLRKGRLRAVKEQVGYKLPLMLRSRCALPGELRETLFGDDAEVDALIYSLYADLLCGRSDGEDVEVLLEGVGATAQARKHCAQSLASIVRSGDNPEPVETIFIHLDSGSPPARFAALGPRLIPVFNYYQAALVLFARGHLSAKSVLRITAAFLAADRCGPWELANLFQDIVRRGHLPYEAMERLAMAVQDESRRNDAAEVLWSSAQRMADLGGIAARSEVGEQQRLDYPALLAQFKSARRAARRSGKTSSESSGGPQA